MLKKISVFRIFRWFPTRTSQRSGCEKSLFIDLPYNLVGTHHNLTRRTLDRFSQNIRHHNQNTTINRLATTHDLHQPTPTTSITMQTKTTSNLIQATLHGVRASSSRVSTPVKKPTNRAQFIPKLHTMISEENGSIVEWLPDGLSFLIKDPTLFATSLLPKYCGHKTFTSFERQMNFYR